MENKSIHVFAPATVANVACGFDIFGFALEEPGDELVVKLVSDHKRVKITKISGDNGRLSLDSDKNTAGVSVLALLRALNKQQGVEIELYKKMPLGSGLGSSAASAVGSLFAVNQLLGSPLSLRELLPFALEGEKSACGSAHADNVAPSLLGGFVLIRSYTPLDVVSVPCRMELYCTILHPHLEINTGMARSILKREVSLQQHVTQSGNAVALALGLAEGNADLVRKSLEDVIVEPVRARLIPGFYTLKGAALQAGALGCSLSGSGPSLFALSTSEEAAKSIGNAMKRTCDTLSLGCDVYLSKINLQGPRVLS